MALLTGPLTTRSISCKREVMRGGNCWMMTWLASYTASGGAQDEMHSYPRWGAVGHSIAVLQGPAGDQLTSPYPQCHFKPYLARWWCPAFCDEWYRGACIQRPGLALPTLLGPLLFIVDTPRPMVALALRGWWQRGVSKLSLPRGETPHHAEPQMG